MPEFEALAPSLRFLMMVDHFDHTATGKMMLMGTFERVHGRRQPELENRVPFQHGWLVGLAQCSVAYGATHTIDILCCDLDSNEMFTSSLPGLEFVSSGAGEPMRAAFAIRMGPILFPDFGNYEWVVKIDGTVVDRLQFGVWEAPDA